MAVLLVPALALLLLAGTAGVATAAGGRFATGVPDGTPSGDPARSAAAADSIAGGDAIYRSGARCSLGFTVHRDTTYYFVTAGHCLDGIPAWYADPDGRTAIGSTMAAEFPGDDYGIVRYTDPGIAHPSAVDLHPGDQDITTVGTAYLGEVVSRSGAATGVRTGVVTGLDATVSYAGGTVRGLIRTDICAEPGDAGGPLFAGTVALGLLSAASGDCGTGGTSYYQPIRPVLDAYGVTLP